MLVKMLTVIKLLATKVIIWLVNEWMYVSFAQEDLKRNLFVSIYIIF